MSDTTCPKCGAPVACRHVNGYEVIYGCDAAMRHGGFFVDSYRCLRDALATMTARAEKAEAQRCVGNECKAVRMVESAAERAMNREEEAIKRAEKAEAMAEYRLEAIRARDAAATDVVEPVIGWEPNGDSEPKEILGDEEVWCLYRSCGGGPNEHGPNCPTVTHPAEEDHANP